ncbi:DUF2188 domain-containing protein [Metabacillus sp. 84]|uniref:DUF2188 domain-containing protein n=1 Tax=unclassified Metabacillus TaxID=2675274 RepID=UPI003CF3201F
MPWNSRNYPESMKNLPGKTRKKAIEIANALLDEKYEEGRAIAIATAQAEKWAQDEGAKEAYKLHKRDEKWIIEKDSAERASFSFHTKKEALTKARKLAEEKNISISVFKQDGSEDQTIN